MVFVQSLSFKIKIKKYASSIYEYLILERTLRHALESI